MLDLTVFIIVTIIVAIKGFVEVIIPTTSILGIASMGYTLFLLKHEKKCALFKSEVRNRAFESITLDPKWWVITILSTIVSTILWIIP